MVVFSVLYPATPQARFDVAYYTSTHLPLVEQAFAATGLKSVQAHQGLSAGDGGGAPYVAMAHLTFDGPEALEASLTGPRASEVFADIANFTDIAPLTQVSAPMPR